MYKTASQVLVHEEFKLTRGLGRVREIDGSNEDSSPNGLTDPSSAMSPIFSSNKSSENRRHSEGNVAKTEL